MQASLTKAGYEIPEEPIGPTLVATANGRKLTGSYGAYLFANMKFYTGKSYLYAGIKGGAMLSQSVATEMIGSDIKLKGTGAMAGVQAGYDVYLNHHFSLYAEVCPAYYRVSYTGGFPEAIHSSAETSMYITGMLGVKYGF